MNTLMNASENAQPFRTYSQLQHLRLPAEIICENGEPLQLPKFTFPVEGLSPAKQAFQAVENAQVADFEDYENNANLYDSDPEILLSDSDEEELEEDIMDNEDAEADTECGSDVLSTGGEERIDTLDDFDSQQANASFEQIMSAREESSEKTEQQPAAHSVYFQLLRRSHQTEINEVPVRRGLQEI